MTPTIVTDGDDADVARLKDTISSLAKQLDILQKFLQLKFGKKFLLRIDEHSSWLIIMTSCLSFYQEGNLTFFLVIRTKSLQPHPFATRILHNLMI